MEIGEVEINSFAEFLEAGGRREHYVGKGIYSWQDLEFPTDHYGRTPPDIIRTFFFSCDHPVVVAEKKRLAELHNKLAKVRDEIWELEKSIYAFEDKAEGYRRRHEK